jgi:hypothetical protein
MLCGWMWEILFGDEDWHTDVSQWVVVEPEIERMNAIAIKPEVQKKPTWWMRWCGLG